MVGAYSQSRLSPHHSFSYPFFHPWLQQTRGSPTRASSRENIIGAGYILAAIISMVLMTIYCFRYVSSPTAPALHGAWLHIHFVFLSMACSAVLVASIFSFVRLTRNAGFPAVSLVLQSVTVMLLFASIIAGAVWAHSAFGSSWSWDPKETWSLILLSTSIIVYTYAALHVPSAISQVVISTLYLALFVFGVFGVTYFLGGLWPAFLLSR